MEVEEVSNRPVDLFLFLLLLMLLLMLFPSGHF